MGNSDPIASSDVIWLWAAGAAAAAFVNFAIAGPARAERIENGVAVFSGLDKVTARISKFEVELGKSAAFGALKVTPRACYSRPSTEQPKTTTFVEVDEVQLDGAEKRIFTGWMFAESPGLYGVEHPTVDVWLTECKSPTKTAAQRPVQPPRQGGVAAPADAADDGAAIETPAEAEAPLEPRRRVRR
ncbi:MAG: DUF2155 domain-containing protein [Hyphomicrobium sp.]